MYIYASTKVDQNVYPPNLAADLEGESNTKMTAFSSIIMDSKGTQGQKKLTGCCISRKLLHIGQVNMENLLLLWHVVL